MLHGCTVGDGSLIGIRSRLEPRSSAKAVVGAGAVITERKVFADGTLILGAPAKVVRELPRRENLLSCGELRRARITAATCVSLTAQLRGETHGGRTVSEQTGICGRVGVGSGLDGRTGSHAVCSDREERR
jgi:carbonic anhydrase/acetyltransferase-like protein (isoleucine patch superfamily)